MVAENSLILVPVNGSVMDERAIDVAVLLARRYHASVTALHVVVVPQRLPLDADLPEEIERGEAILQRAQQLAEHYGYDIEVELLQARRAGAVIVDEALGRGARMIVMGAMIHRGVGEKTVGQTTVPYVLKYAPCEVVICRRQLDQGA